MSRIYIVVMGLSVSDILLVCTGASFVRTFFIATGTFGAMSLYGHTTSRDLIRVGSILLIGQIDIIAARMSNRFVASPTLEFAISIIGVAVFVGLASAINGASMAYPEGVPYEALKQR